MSSKIKTIFVCPRCGAHLERQHWGWDAEKLKFQDLLTCEDPNCQFYKLVECECKLD